MENPKFSGGLRGALGAARAERMPESLSERPILSATWGYGGFGPEFYRIEIKHFIGAIMHREFDTRSGGQWWLGANLRPQAVQHAYVSIHAPVRGRPQTPIHPRLRLRFRSTPP